MINRVVLVGRIVANPELSYTPSGVAKCTFTLAVNRPFSNQQGEREADFIRIECWRKIGENVANFTRKGSLVGIDGSIRTGSYEGQDGKRVYFTNVNAESVQFLEPRGEGGQPQQTNPSQSHQQPPQQNQQQYQAPPQQQYGQQYQQPPQNQQNYTRVDEDPFARNNGPVEVSEDDLPFRMRPVEKDGDNIWCELCNDGMIQKVATIEGKEFNVCSYCASMAG